MNTVRQMAVVLLGALISCSSTGGTKGGLFYVSQVAFDSPNKGDGDLLRARVGHRFTARVVSTFIGWAQSDSDGTMHVVQPYVTDPEYILFGDELPPGLQWEASTGTLHGTPRSPGKWCVTPAVRCRARGDDVYHGQGYWWTSYVTHEGKTWTRSKTSWTIDVSD